ncbi:MAG TPA: nicotinamide riboside transporter PnuC [Thermoanaerobaculia bacterium]|nr:nicotinamide riboside transporter PnuC [Thermoanaerobaculia bacterium]
MIELPAFLITIASIWLATRQNIWYYPTGIVSVLLYAWIFFGARLYAETALQFVWLVLMIYGWYEWLHGGADRRELPVSRTPRWGWITAIVSGAVMTAVIVWIQRTFTDNPAPVVDSSIAAWSIVAQWMTARKWLENWLLWIAVNVIAVPLYVTRELWLTALLYAILFVLGIQGYRRWRGTLVR